MSYMRKFKQLVTKLNIIGQGMAGDVLHDLLIIHSRIENVAVQFRQPEIGRTLQRWT
jgi:hypothetical protein